MRTRATTARLRPQSGGQEDFHAIATAALDAVVVVDSVGAIRLWNPAAERMFGYTADEAIGTELSRILSTEPQQDVEGTAPPQFQRTGAGAAVGKIVQLPARRKNGEAFLVEMSLAELQQGGCWHGVGIIREVSRQSHDMQVLQSRGILLRTLVDALPDTIFAKDRAGRKTLANVADVRSLGAEREEDVLGRTDFELLGQATAQACYADDMRVIELGEAVYARQELIINHRGEQRWMETTKLPLRDAAGQTVGLVGIGHDITRRLQSEEQLRKLSKAVEQSPASVVITDTAGRIEYVNPKFCELTGYRVEEVLGQNPRVLRSGETPTAEYQTLWGNLCAGLEWRGEFHNRKKTGELYWEFAVISPIKDGDGKITHFVAVKEDITERKRIDKERNQLEIKLRHSQKLQAVGQLAAGIAHEINTPTQYIGDNLRFMKESVEGLQRFMGEYEGLLEAARQYPALAERVQRVTKASQELDIPYALRELPNAVEQALHGVERVTRIVRAMKDFSHPGTEEATAVDLRHAIESTLEVSRNEWKYVADTVTEFDPGLPAVRCLPGELNQVILNLVVNAAHAIGDVPATEGRGKGTISIKTRRDGSWAEIRVSDTGTGIPESARDRIFDPFFTTKAVGKGSGQGLAIAHSVVVDKHGGEILFETEIGRGTTFIIRLPLEKATASTAPHP